MEGNLFIGASNKQLKECYESYVRVQCDKRNKKELFDDMQSGYIGRIDCNDEKKKNIIAFSMAREHMFCEISRRFFKVCESFDAVINELK